MHFVCLSSISTHRLCAGGFYSLSNLEKAKSYSAVGALIVAAVLSFLSFHASNDVTANMLILIAQFLVYSLTLFGFGELANRIFKSMKK